LLIGVQQSFKNILDIFQSNQAVYYNFRSEIVGTGKKSVSQNWLGLVIVLKYVIKRWT